MSRGRVIQLTESRSTWPKNANDPGEIGASVYIWPKNQWNFGGVSQNHAKEGGFFNSGFLECLGEVALATFNEKPECEKDSGFLMPV